MDPNETLCSLRMRDTDVWYRMLAPASTRRLIAMLGFFIFMCPGENVRGNPLYGGGDIYEVE